MPNQERDRGGDPIETNDTRRHREVMVAASVEDRYVRSHPRTLVDAIRADVHERPLPQFEEFDLFKNVIRDCPATLL